MIPWDQDEVQFPRLLSEIRGIGLTEDQWTHLMESMDITSDELDELFTRAEHVWEDIKEKRVKP